MGFLEDLAGSSLGGGGESGGMHPALLSGLVQKFLGRDGGGLQGLLGMFQKQGLGEYVASWVGTGANLPISAAQIKSVLGEGNIQQLASQAGLSNNEAGSQLAKFLPGLIDKLTPGGAIPQGGLQELLGLLK